MRIIAPLHFERAVRLSVRIACIKFCTCFCHLLKWKKYKSRVWKEKTKIKIDKCATMFWIRAFTLNKISLTWPHGYYFNDIVMIIVFYIWFTFVTVIIVIIVIIVINIVAVIIIIIAIIIIIIISWTCKFFLYCSWKEALWYYLKYSLFAEPKIAFAVSCLFLFKKQIFRILLNFGLDIRVWVSIPVRQYENTPWYDKSDTNNC